MNTKRTLQTLAGLFAAAPMLITATASAKPPDWSLAGSGSGAAPTGGPYKEEYGVGFTGGAGAYRSLAPELGLGLRLDAGGIAGEGDIEGSLGNGTLGFAALSPALRYRPLQGKSQNGNRGLYFEFAGGLSLLEEQLEPIVAPAAGYIIDAGGFGVGPTARYMQVLMGQGDAPEGEDLRIMTVGLELVFLDGDRAQAPPAAYEPEPTQLEPSASIPTEEVQPVAGADEDSDAEMGPDGRMLLEERVFFGNDEASLRPEGKQELDRIAQLYKQRQPGENWSALRVSGHADQRGPESYNMELSRERAENVRAYLTTQGVPASIIDVKAYGEEQPVVPDPDTAAEFQQNRRVRYNHPRTFQRTGVTSLSGATSAPRATRWWSSAPLFPKQTHSSFGPRRRSGLTAARGHGPNAVMRTDHSARRRAIFQNCERFLSGHGPRRVQDELTALAAAAEADQTADNYGSGGVLEALETEVAALLGKPAAVFMPSGTMAQQIAMRLHTESTRCSSIAFHPTCHLELHEHRGYGYLHRLQACLIGRRDRMLELADLEAVAQPIGALLLELPQREIGGCLPSWELLQSQADWARERGIPLHLDGARLWECAPFYQKTYAEIASLFDSVYVSFYKALGAIAGAALLGSEDFISEARLWQRRHGGNLVSMYPFALSAREGLKNRLGKMTAYRDRAQRVAECLVAMPGVRIAPNPPQTNLFHVYFPVDGERLLEASAALAQAERLALFTRTRPCDVPGYCAVEVSIGDAVTAIGDDEIENRVWAVLEQARHH